MITNVVMPQMGESVTEGTITTWYKKVGDWVEKDEALLLIGTDKVDAEVPSPESGYVQEVRFPEGETVEVDTVVAVLSPEKNGAPAAPSAPSSRSEAEEADLEGRVTGPGPTPVTNLKDADAGQLRRTRSSPLVRKMAAEHDIDLSNLRGTGVSGRVTKKDIEAYIESLQTEPAVASATSTVAPPPPAAAPVRPAPDSRYLYQPVGSDRIEPFSPMRSQIADHMVISRETSVHVTTVFEVDMTRVVRLREKHKAEYASRGVKLSYMPFIIKAVVDGIRAYPVVNSSVVERSIAYRQDVNIGMAVALDWGLLVPVINRADEKSIKGLAREVSELAERARNRKLGPDDLQGGTFTITNPGVFGSLFGTPIINQPQVAILCVGTITKRPVVVEDDAIAVRHMMYLSLSFDHRVIDGATGDRFMKTIKDTLENFHEEHL